MFPRSPRRLFQVLLAHDVITVKHAPSFMAAHAQKRIVGFALKSRLASLYTRRESLVAGGGLMYCGADLADSYRRVAYLRGQNFEGSQLG